jgi:hypothetical protein
VQTAYVPVSLSYNREKFNEECQNIIERINDRLIDLAPVLLDDENSNYADQIQEKQTRFKQEFD